MLVLTGNRYIGMTVEMWHYRGRRAMVDGVQKPTNAPVGNETAESTPAPDTSAEVIDSERVEPDQTTAQRRARLQKEIRAGMQRALKQQG